MIPLRKLSLRLAVAPVLYAALAWPWPGTERAGEVAFRHALQPWRAAVPQNWRVQIYPSPVDPNRTTEIAVRRARSPRVSYQRWEGRSVLWLPAALFTALLAATPMSRRGRGRSLVAGAAGLYVLALVRIGTGVAVSMYELRSPGPPATWGPMLGYVDCWLAQPLELGFAAAVLSWVACTARAAVPGASGPRSKRRARAQACLDPPKRDHKLLRGPDRALSRGRS